MIPARPYIEPAKDKLANYKQITARHEAIVLARHVADRWFVRRRWENQFGGGQSDFHLLPLGDTSFVQPGWYTVSIVDWTRLVSRSLNQTCATAKATIHEWRYENEGGPLRYHDMPIAQLGDVLTLLHPMPVNPLTVLVRSRRGQRFVMYYEHLHCESDIPTTTQNDFTKHES